MKYYIDTSIWLNLFKREGDETKGTPYWKIAEDFLKRAVDLEYDEIVYSFVVLRELEIKLNKKEYEKRKKEIMEERKFIRIDVLQEDKDFARELESRYDFEVSFYDMIHLAIAKRVSATIVTRDRQLIMICKENHVKAKRPEDILGAV
jgi:predicted nucleic acid-binding protein